MTGGVLQNFLNSGVFVPFSTTLWTGDASTRSILTGRDADVVWIKSRTQSDPHAIFSVDRSAGRYVVTSNTAGQSTVPTSLTAFTSTGFDLGAAGVVNALNEDYVGWSFVNSADFFDSVTYTGDGTASQTVAHSLGSAPGAMIVYAYDTAGLDRYVYHSQHNGGTSPEGYFTKLNTVEPEATSSTIWANTAPDGSNFTVGSPLNTSGVNYEALIFGADAQRIVCGEFTTDGSGEATVSTGWAPGWLMIKVVDTGTGRNGWNIFDPLRLDGNDPQALFSNNQDAEPTGDNPVTLLGNGFQLNNGNGWQSNNDHIYIAIRRGV